MKNLYVRTTYEELEIKNIVPSEIIEDGDYIIFGDKAKVARDHFVSYQFIEVKENE
jgi:hypothetical protein